METKVVCSPLLLGEWQRINKIGLGHLFSFDFQIAFGGKRLRM